MEVEEKNNKKILSLEDRFAKDFVNNYKPSYQYIFWDRPEIQRMIPHIFWKYISTLREIGELFTLYSVLFRYIERGSAYEGLFLFRPDKIEYVLNHKKFWHLNERRLQAWKRALNILKVNQSNILKDGVAKNNGSSSEDYSR